MMNDLKNFFMNHKGNMIHKWLHYFDIYDLYFSKYRGKEICFVEIGVFQGGSLQMWKEYFGPKAKIYGIDINPECKQFEDEQVTIFIGDQEDKKFLEKIKRQIPNIDILLDDGGHTMKQQINTFEALFPHIKSDGIYLCEDIHTSYWSTYGGGYKRKSSFIEYSKNLIDYINAWHSHSEKLSVNSYTKNIRALHFYDSMIVIEKDKIQEPFDEKRGSETIVYLKKITIKGRIKNIKNTLISKFY